MPTTTEKLPTLACPLPTASQPSIDNRQSAIDNGPSAMGNRQLAISLARFLLVVVLMGAPWAFGAVVPWAWVALGVAASVILFLWGLGSVRQGALRLVWSPLYVPLGVFFLWGVIQYATRLPLDRWETREALVLLATDLALFFLTVQLFSTASRDVWRGFGFIVLVLAGALGVFAILQFAAGEREIYGIVATPGNLQFGPYVNPNHFAGLMEMLIPVAALYIAERHGKRPLAALIWLCVAVAMAIASLLLSGSRGGVLALATEIVIGIAVVAGLFRPASGILNLESGIGGRNSKIEKPVLIPQPREKDRKSPIGNRQSALVTAFVSTILASVLLFTWVDPGIVAQKLGLIIKVGGPAWVEWAGFRKQVASDALRMLRDHPLSGVGLGNFETAYPGYQSFPSDEWIDYAHNDYVQAVAETGLPGALLILVALGLFLRAAFGSQDSGARCQVRNLESEISNLESADRKSKMESRKSKVESRNSAQLGSGPAEEALGLESGILNLEPAIHSRKTCPERSEGSKIEKPVLSGAKDRKSHELASETVEGSIGLQTAIDNQQTAIGNRKSAIENGKSPAPDPGPLSHVPYNLAPCRWLRLGAALGCCGLLVHSFFDFNLHIPANAAWFAVLAGLATSDFGF